MLSFMLSSKTTAWGSARPGELKGAPLRGSSVNQKAYGQQYCAGGDTGVLIQEMTGSVHIYVR